MINEGNLKNKNYKSSMSTLNKNKEYDFNILNSEITSTNLAFKKQVTSSSNESTNLVANYITDGRTTRWASRSLSNSEQQWIYVDLGEITQFDTIKISWYLAFATMYKIEVSNDAIIWNLVYSTTSGVGKIEIISLDSKQNARYVRVFCEKNNINPKSNVSIYEIEIYNLRILTTITSATNTIPPFGVIPTNSQIKYQKQELIAFIHFGVNTFTGNEWGNGKEDPNIFSPTTINTDQWIKALADSGFVEAILTAKHHDGFCLWPSAYTKFSVASSSWMGGKGDIVKMVSDSCAKYGVKFGVYLSPWDQNSSFYGTGDDYNKYYMNQLTELLTNYGPIYEVWMDGAKGSNVVQDYKFNDWFALIKKLQSQCLIFGPNSPDVRWIGNENGYAGEPCWSTINRSKIPTIYDLPSYLNVGEENADSWVVGEADVSIRPGWFYHSEQDTSIKSLSKLLDIYYNSVGRNATLLLNVPPDKRGLFTDGDVNRLKEFGDTIKAIFVNNLGLNKSVTVDSVYNNSSNFDGNKILDGNYDTYWAPKSGATTGTIEVDLGKLTEFDVISIQEYIPLGQRIAEFNVQVQQNGSWNTIFSGKTIGYKRLIRLAPILAQKIKVNIIRSLSIPLINNIGVYKQPSNISLPSQPQGTQLLNNSNLGSGVNQFNFSDGWTSETINTDQAYGGDDHWTTQVGATSSISFVAPKFYIVAIKDPNHGIMTISIDGGTEFDIDLYASERTFKQIVYESATLANSQHKITLKCSGRKNAKAGGIAAFIDCIFIETVTGLTFFNNSNLGAGINQFNFGDGWTSETINTDQAYGGDDHWTTQIGATVTTSFKGTKFYIIAIKDPNHGIMEVSIDNGAPIDVDLYNSIRIFKQVVFESADLTNNNHTVAIKCSGRKNTKSNGIAAFIDGIFALDNGGTGLFEIENSQYSFNENIGVVTFKVLRKGGSNGSVEIDYGTFAGTALDGVNYQPWSGTLSFNTGEREKVVNLTIINTNSITTSKNFILKLSRPLGGAVLGITTQAIITLLPKSSTTPTTTPITKPTTNLALNKKGISSSNESNNLIANYAFDGRTTRWASGSLTNGQQWVYVDLGQITEFNRIKISWYLAFATIYRIEVSNDATVWTSVYRSQNSLGKVETINLSSKQNARYVRVFCEKNNVNSKSNVSIYEIEIYNIEVVLVNLALNKQAVSSSNAASSLAANLVTDGNTASSTSRWSSGPFTNGQQWIYVDLGQVTQFDTIKLYWEVANATIYRIEISNDATVWTSIYRTTQGIGGIENITLPFIQNARYIRVYCEKNNTGNSVSLYEIEIYNTGTVIGIPVSAPINLALNKQAVSSSNETNYLANLVTDGNATSSTSRWSSGPFTNGQQWIYVDLGQVTQFDTLKLCWEVANSIIYRIEVSNDTINWTSVYRTTQGAGGIEIINLTSSQSARYVRVYCEKNNTVNSVSLYEIEIYNTMIIATPVSSLINIVVPPINLALNKKAYGRSVQGNNIASNILDGNLNTYWDGGQYPSYIEVDLEQIYSLDSINLVNYVDGTRYYYYAIYGSVDGINFIKIAKKFDNNKATIDGDTFRLNKSFNARYLRVLIEYCSANEAAHISELRVYGNAIGQVGDLPLSINIENFSNTSYTLPITITETLSEVSGIIERRLGNQYISWFKFIIEPNANNALDYFEISNGNNGVIQIKGNNGVSLATGLNYYLKYNCKVLLTQTGEAVQMPLTAPQLTNIIRKECPYKSRYAFNYCTFSYTMAFWGDKKWQAILDWLALNGINLVLDLTAQCEVWRRFLSKIGYNLTEIKNWLVGPAYIAWEYMDNMSVFGGPLPNQYFSAKTELARKMQRKMKALGMNNILQGFFGMVPADIQNKKPGINIIPQGQWCAFDRPAIIKPDSAEFKTFATLFYTCQEEVYGKNYTNYYSADPFMEGGSSGGVSQSIIYQNVLDTMLAYNNNAIWIRQSWSHNPSQDGLNGVVGDRRKNILVLDLYAEVDPRWKGKSVWGYTWNSPEFDGTPWVWCMLNNFGGRMGIDGPLTVLATEIPNAYNTTSQGKLSKMQGIGMSPESLETNPVLYDLLFEMAWTLNSVDVEIWLKEYVTRRYGKYTNNIYNAWKVFNKTAYAKRNGYYEGAIESIINARPKFGVTSSAVVGSLTIYYDKIQFEQAVQLLFADYDILNSNQGYLFDLADFLRQVLANSAQQCYNKLISFYNIKDQVNFKIYADKFLEIIKLQEKILSTQRPLLVGSWIEDSKEVSFDEFSKDVFELNARALITTWGGIVQSETGGLHDYSNRQWAGLTGDLYYGRWQLWLDSLKNALTTGTQPQSIDWFKFDWNWVIDNKVYANKPSNLNLKDLGNQVFNQFTIAKLS